MPPIGKNENGRLIAETVFGDHDAILVRGFWAPGVGERPWSVRECRTTLLIKER